MAFNPNFFQQTQFVTTAAELTQVPDHHLPELAFVGRSNSGKSSTINALTLQNRLAFVSKMPGRTQHLNFFSITQEKMIIAYLVDLPGYGFSQASKSTEKTWKYYLSPYLQCRSNLCALVMVLDIRHGLTNLDEYMLQWFLPTQKTVHIVLNKADKLSRTAIGQAQAKLWQDLKNLYTPHALTQIQVHVFSAEKKLGFDALAESLQTSIQTYML